MVNDLDLNLKSPSKTIQWHNRLFTPECFINSGIFGVPTLNWISIYQKFYLNNKFWSKQSGVQYQKQGINNKKILIKENIDQQLIKLIKNDINTTITILKENNGEMIGITPQLKRVVQLITGNDSYNELRGPRTPPPLVYLAMTSIIIRDQFVIQELKTILKDDSLGYIQEIFQGILTNWKEMVQRTLIKPHSLYKLIQVGIREALHWRERGNEIKTFYILKKVQNGIKRILKATIKYQNDQNKNDQNNNNNNNENNNDHSNKFVFIKRHIPGIIRSSLLINNSMTIEKQQIIKEFRSQLNNNGQRQLITFIQWIIFYNKKSSMLQRFDLRNKISIINSKEFNWIIGMIPINEVHFPINPNQKLIDIERYLKEKQRSQKNDDQHWNNYKQEYYDQEYYDQEYQGNFDPYDGKERNYDGHDTS